MAVETQQIGLGADDHVVTFYDRDDDLCRTVGAFLAGAIKLGGGAIAIATEAHRRLIEAELRTSGIDVTDALGSGTLALCDAAATMASFMPDGRIDGDGFERVIGSVLRNAAKTGGPVRAYGEMVALLWDRGDVPAAIELEERWNALARDHEFCLLCGYRASSVLGHGHADGLDRVCRLHSAVLSPPTRDTREVSGHFAAHADAPKAARRLVADALRRWGHPDTLLADAQLVLSELASNAVLHASSGFSVAVRSTDGGVRLSVRDSSPAAPAVRDAPSEASGRGLRIVSTVASSWGVEPAPDGKVVWAELRA